MPVTRKAERDARDYDTTQLHRGAHGRILHRDYSAHFFRWSFARRLIKKTDQVLDVGCGQETPLKYVLLHSGPEPLCRYYVGVDLNPLKPVRHQRAQVYGEFNLVERWVELSSRYGGFDVVTCLEVIEHLHSRLQPKLLQAIWKLLKPGGSLVISTPCYDGRRMAANHIRELTIEELQRLLVKAGFRVEKRFGTFMDVKQIGKSDERCDPAAVQRVYTALKEYFDNDALSNIFGPLYPDHARNNLWIARRV